ncbi:glycosyltransferase family 4 protein [bacterium]|nr:glycosyltransferase family 4 protein [bacterium]
MRVLLDCRPLQTTSRVRGLGSYLIQLAQEYLQLRPRDFEFSFLFWETAQAEKKLLAALIGKTQSAEILQNSVFMPPGRWSKLGWLKDALFNKNNWLKAVQGVDLIHFPSIFELNLGWPKQRLPVPKVVTVHDLMPVTHADMILKGKHRVLKPLYKFQAGLLNEADAVIFASDNTQTEAKELLKSQNLQRKIFHGAGERFKAASPEQVKAVREKYRLPEQFIFFLGGLSPNKNLISLLKAARLTALPPLVVAGGYRPQDCQAFKRDFPEVLWLGCVPNEDVPPLYTACSLYVMPSLCEGFGLPLAEAMRCGAPTACSNRPPMTEIVGGAGILFDPHDPADIAAKLNEALQNPERLQELRRKSLDRGALFTFRNTALQTLELYRKAALEFKQKS